MQRKHPKKICIMHRASIGDMLLATPVYRAVKRRYPDSELVVVTNHAGYEMFYGNPNIDKLVAYQKEDRIWTHLPAIRAIRHSDVALIMDIHHRNAVYAFLAGIPIRIGGGGEFINRRPKYLKGPRYDAWHYMGYAATIDAYSEDIRLEPLRPTAAEKARVQSAIAAIKAPGQKLVVIVPHSLSPLKDWSAEKYREIMRRFQQGKWTVVALGGGKRSQADRKGIPYGGQHGGQMESAGSSRTDRISRSSDQRLHRHAPCLRDDGHAVRRHLRADGSRSLGAAAELPRHHEKLSLLALLWQGAGMQR